MLKGIYLRLCYYSSYQNEHITNRYVKIVHIFQYVFSPFIFIHILSKLVKSSPIKNLSPKITINKAVISSKHQSLPFKYFILTSSLLFIILLSLNKAEAIFVNQSVKPIEGSLPYLALDKNGVYKVTKSSDFLNIKLPDGKIYVPEEGSILNTIVDKSTSTKPIELPKDIIFSQIDTLVPFGNYPSVPLNTVFDAPNNFWKDDDDDKNFSATGNLTVKWVDSYGEDVTSKVKNAPWEKLDPCASPYKLTLSISDFKLMTQYGVPKESSMVAKSHDYYLRPAVEKPYACYAKPSFNYDSATNPSLQDVDGPEWVAGKGFKAVIDDDDSNTSIVNFPSTGANNLYFDLILAGVTAKEVIDGYPDGDFPSTAGGSVPQPPSAKLSIPPGQDANLSNQLRVTLIGPNTGITKLRNNMFAPTQFSLMYKKTNTLIYKFSIVSWYMFVNQQFNTIDEFKKFCLRQGNGWTGFNIAKVDQLTNANAYTWNNGISGRQINNYRRSLNYNRSGKPVGGIFSEWGSLSEQNYPGSGWVADIYITQSTYDGDHRYYVDSRDGRILKQDGVSSNYGQVCAGPYILTSSERVEIKSNP
ncbi:hypothetical protein A9G11_00855 [Gilliamella sp. wkB108]|uniref:hypothetical protein n=1 Tax=Gilliamella sp. wkB108 TaxID=3120256 RepID=UPI00080D9C29|nr:hypothetical protein [Gilliamella apicola]OCG26322.1 hypothetical protein A9G11_00855 [Gilliamella apicola]